MTQTIYLRVLQYFILGALCFTASAAQSPLSGPAPLLGFDNDGSARQRTLEKQFDSFIKTDDLRDWMKRLTARPHHLGSPADKENAEFMAGLFRSWGFETQI